MLMEERMDGTVDCTIHIDRANERVMPELLAALHRQGLSVITTFDLQAARAPHEECPCPHHGTANCNCQYAVLLIYEPESDFAVYRTLTVHGQDEQVWLSLLQRPGTPAGKSGPHATLEAKVMEALQRLDVPAPVSVAAEDDPVPEGEAEVRQTGQRQV